MKGNSIKDEDAISDLINTSKELINDDNLICTCSDEAPIGYEDKVCKKWNKFVDAYNKVIGK